MELLFWKLVVLTLWVILVTWVCSKVYFGQRLHYHRRILAAHDEGEGYGTQKKR